MPNFKIHQEGDFNYVTKDTEEPVEDYTELLDNLLKKRKYKNSSQMDQMNMATIYFK